MPFSIRCISARISLSISSTSVRCLISQSHSRCCNCWIKWSIGATCEKCSTGSFCPGIWRISVGSAVIGRLRLGRTSVPTMALMVVDFPAFMVPTIASTISSREILRNSLFSIAWRSAILGWLQGKASCGASSPGTERGIFSSNCNCWRESCNRRSASWLNSYRVCVYIEYSSLKQILLLLFSQIVFEFCFRLL